MKKIEFRSYSGGYCAFTDSSIVIANSELKEGRVYPFGSIAKLSSSRSLKIVTVSGETALFPMRYMRKKSRLKIKELVRSINEKKASFENIAPFTEVIDETKKKRIEGIHTPHRSKTRIIKFWLTVTIIICALLILACLTVGFIKSHSGYNPAGEDVRLSWENLW